MGYGIRSTKERKKRYYFDKFKINNMVWDLQKELPT